MEQGPTGGEHRVDEEHGLAGQILRECLEVGHGLVGLFIAGEADEADLRIRDHGQRRVDHAQASADDWDDDRGFLQAVALGGIDRGIYVEGLDLQVHAGFVDQHGAEIREGGPEGCVVAVLIPHDGEARGRQRVLDHLNIHRFSVY